jgi:hypothetical protein
MIKNDKELDAAVKSLGFLQNAVISLKRELEGAHPDTMNLLMEPYFSKINQFNTEIREYLVGAEGIIPGSELQVKLEGEKVKTGEISLPFITKFFSRIQTTVRDVAFHLKGVKFVPTEDHIGGLRQATSMVLMATGAGSFQLALKFEPHGVVGDFFREPVPQAALQTILEIAKRVELKQAEETDLSDLPITPSTRIKVLRFIHDFSPSKVSGIEHVHFIRYTGGEKRIISLKRESRDYLEGILVSELGQLREVKGRIVAFNHIYKSFAVEVTPGKTLRCHYTEEMEDVVLTQIMKVVLVRGEAEFIEGTEELKRIREVFDIQPLEED